MAPNLISDQRLFSSSHQSLISEWNLELVFFCYFYIDLRSVFEGAQAYVMLSRIKELDQLYILEELPENKIYPIQKALEEIRRIEKK